MRFTCFAALLVLSFNLFAQDLSAEQAAELLKSSDVLLIDVRSQEEYQAGALPNSINIPHHLISSGINQRAVDSEKTIVLYCRSGRRSGMAEQELRARGYSKVYNAGGYEALKAALKP